MSRVVVGYLDGHEWSACFGLSLRDLYLSDQAGPGLIVRPGGRELRKVAGSMGLSDGRNQIARSFLDETDGDWLWFVDSDMGFGPDTVADLVASADPVERPVVGGLCFGLRQVAPGPFNSQRFGIVPTLYALVETETEVGFAPMPDYPRDSVTRVSATGAACLLIHRSALESARLKHGDAWFDLITHPTGDNGKPRTFSEDLSFCIRLAQVGIPMYVNTAVKTTHHKGGIFLDEEMFLGQQEALAGPAPD
jgi:hypothetical protein